RGPEAGHGVRELAAAGSVPSNWAGAACPAWRRGGWEEYVGSTKERRRDLHALNEDGMLVCNPRDREAAHRAQVEAIATEDPKSVTCRKCRAGMKGTVTSRGG